MSRKARRSPRADHRAQITARRVTGDPVARVGMSVSEHALGVPHDTQIRMDHTCCGAFSERQRMQFVREMQCNATASGSSATCSVSRSLADKSGKSLTRCRRLARHTHTHTHTHTCTHAREMKKKEKVIAVEKISCCPRVLRIPRTCAPLETETF